MSSRKHIFVVVSGKKQHGKDYFASRLLYALLGEDISATCTAFASPIKNFCNDVFGIPMEDMETEEGKLKSTHIQWKDIATPICVKFDKTYMACQEEYLTIREVLQIIGTDLFRDQLYGPIWAEAPFLKQHRFKALMQTFPYDVVIITDCRFPNEVAESKKNDALLVRVEMIDAPESGDTHISETALDNWVWKWNEIALNTGEPECFDKYIKQVLLPRIKGKLYGN